MGTTYRVRLARALAIGCVTIGGVGWCASSVFAAQFYPFAGGFGPDGSEASAFERPGALGVDQSTGEVYVADLAAGVVEKFDATHKPVAFTGINPAISGGELTGFSFATTEPLSELAVDSASHDFYVVDHGSQSLRAFQADGEPANFTAGPGAGTNEIGGFKELCGVAVDANGDIYTGDYFQGVHVYAPSGELLAVVSAEQRGCNLAVDSHGTVYVDEFEGPVIKYTPSVFPVTSAVVYGAGGTVDGNLSTGVAVEPASDALFVDERTRVVEFDESGQRTGAALGASGAGALAHSEGVAVDSAAGLVYVSDAQGKDQVEVFGPAVTLPTVVTGQASVQLGSVTVTGTVNPEGAELTACDFEYVEEGKYKPGDPNPYAGGATQACVESLAGIGAGTSPVEVHAELTGLAPGTTYHFRLHAANAGGSEVGEDATLATAPLPVITGEEASNMTATAADLGARINPEAQETSYRFEYGTDTSYGGTPLPEGHLPAATAGVLVSQHLEGLVAGTTYHWRVVATNTTGTTTGVDHTFVYDTSAEGLPDGRAYEMVTPAHKNAALLGDIFSGSQAAVAEDGSRLILPSLQCFGDASSCIVERVHVGAQYAFTRSSVGWVGSALAPSTQEFELNAFWAASADTGAALFSVPSPPNGQEDFYVRSPLGVFSDIGSQAPTPGRNGPAEIIVRGVTSDISHVLFEGPEALWPGDESNGPSLYEYVGVGNASPVLVGVSGGTGSKDLISRCGTSVAGERSAAGQNALSVDGGTVFFVPVVSGGVGSCLGTGVNKEVEPAVEGVYARVGGAETVDVSVRSVSACTGVCLTSVPAGAAFQGASLNGSKVFFTSLQQLTDGASEDTVDSSRRAPGEGGTLTCDAISAHNGCNLYVAGLVRDGEGKMVVGGLQAVSAGDVSGGGPRVQGVMAVADDGSRVYFVARGVLSAAANDQGAVARDGGENLYVSGPGGTRFIATLEESGHESDQWNGLQRGNVTPDGRFLLFTSQAPLTRDDSRGAGGAMQVFRYDAVTGALVRVSIGENGFNDNGNAGVGDAQIASALIARQSAGSAGRTGPSLSADGSRVFFMSPIGLTRGALNDVQIGVSRHDGVTPEYAQNVYEYRDGKVFLVSDGRDANVLPQTSCSFAATISAVCLVGTDASGGDVFFTSADRLVPGDTDSQGDIYDARVCSVGDPCVQPAAPVPAPCGGEACHGIPAAPRVRVLPGSMTFNGAGNVSSGVVSGGGLTRPQKLARALRACHEHHRVSRKRRVACERAARRQFGVAHRNGKRAGRRVGRGVGQ